MGEKTNSSDLNLNTATAKELTQLPGVAKNVAYRILNHRKRHGLFTHWEELLEVKDFPPEALDRVRQRATIAPPPDLREDLLGPRRVKPSHLQEVKKKPKGYTKAIRATRSKDRLKPPA
jgi:competence ComEA-like helix-hairpin-helix protein